MTKVLMLGWEFPPHISGGLGTACEGLSRELAAQGEKIHFVLPRLTGDEAAPFMQMVNLDEAPKPRSWLERVYSSALDKIRRPRPEIEFFAIESWLTPYLHLSQTGVVEGVAWEDLLSQAQHEAWRLASEDGTAIAGAYSAQRKQHYGGDLLQEVERFARRTVAHARSLDFDVIHAHDWMTFPAAVAVSQLSRKPLVLHVHSLESDRSADTYENAIARIERQALQAAHAIIAVSGLTKRKIIENYGIPESRIVVIHNGVYSSSEIASIHDKKVQGRKVVLFLGRVTFQKGPEYFVEMAARVAKLIPNVLFVMAGDGDLLPHMKYLVNHRGLDKYFEFPGFVKGVLRDEWFMRADLYVMPSVSEPFGIAPLEALSFDVPVLISRQSGVSEVLSHALKADFWDIEEMTDLVVGGLMHEELRRDMLAMAKKELAQLKWEATARKTRQVYRHLLAH